MSDAPANATDQSPPPGIPDPRRQSRVWATFKALIRTRVTTGLLVVLPIYITYLLVMFVFKLLRDASLWLIVSILTFYGKTLPPDRGSELAKWWGLKTEKGLSPEDPVVILDAPVAEVFVQMPGLAKWIISIIAVFLTIFVLYSIGLLAANIIGKRVIETMESILDHVPLVKTVYRSSKQILTTFTGDQAQNFQRVALIPFPQERMRCVGFITAVFTDSVTDEELASVFIPTTPNPTTGYLQILRRKDLIELNWSVEDAVRVIMSGGILRPDFITIKAGQYNVSDELPMEQGGIDPADRKPHGFLGVPDESDDKS